MPPTERLPGIDLYEHELEVPLDHSEPSGDAEQIQQIQVFAREFRRTGEGADRPALLFLQGGPGGEPPRPAGVPGWVDRLLQDYRVIMLDQRGTGRSTPFGAQHADDPQAQADYLTHFRADSIVEDAELLREHLGIDTWTLMGQSFGGFCSLAYLSRHASSLAGVIFTGGVPPVGMPVDEIYAATFERTAMLSRRYHQTFPGDADRLRAAIEACDAGQVRLPSGDLLSGRQLRSLGGRLGMSGGDLQLHYLLERDPRSPMFAAGVFSMLPFSGDSPIYTLLHEACYADGGATNWSCARVRPAVYDQDVTLFTAEHPFPWHVQESSGLKQYTETADLLAAHEWPRLYDEDALRAADVPCVAIMYYDDPFVLREHSLATAELLPRMRPWVTNEWLHNGIRADARVVDRLVRMVRGQE
ncbi:alpha/beta fold hydrolase [Dermacoccaceae bacterium W4C1]